MTLRAAGYIRVSSDKQVDTYSLPAQERAIREACTARGYTLVTIYREEGVSAHTDRIDKRPQLAALIESITRHEIDVVFTHSVDRVSRSLLALLTFYKHLSDAHATFVALSDGLDYTTPAGKLQLQIQGAVSEWFSSNVAGHVTKGKGERAHSGKTNSSHAPLGYLSQEKNLIVDPETAPLVKRLFALAAEGCTLRQVRDECSAAGVRRNSTGINYLLHNRVYIGEVQHNGTWYHGTHEAIVDPAIFQLAGQTIASNRRIASKPRSAHPYIFSGLLTCAVCGEHYRAYTTATAGYVCFGREALGICTEHGISERRLSHQIPPLLARLVPPDNILAEIASRQPVPRPRLDVAAIERQMDRLCETYILGDTPRDMYLRERERLRSLLEVREDAPPADLAAIAAPMRDLPTHWQAADVTARNRLLATLFADILMDDQTIVAVKPQPSVAPYLALLFSPHPKAGYYTVPR